MRASADRPLELHVNDFDGNGKAEQILTQYADDGRPYPLVLRDDLIKQLPGLRKTVAGYADYQGKTLAELFPAEVLARSVVNRATELRSLAVLNAAAGPRLVYLPDEAQLAPVYAIATADVDGDDRADILLGGNQSVARPELGIYAGSFGTLLLNRGNGTLLAQPPAATGMYLSGDVRNISPASPPNTFIVARSGAPLLKLEVTTE